MICVMNYTFRIWILLIHFKNAVHLALNFIIYPHDFLRPSAQCHDCNYSDLPSTKYRDVAKGDSASSNADDDSHDCCSVCLVEFSGEDEVCKLAGCGHVFHCECIREWIERDRFTCPLCRSLLFSDLHRICC